jgi:cyanate permease
MFIRFFGAILLAGLSSAALGAAFGVIVALLSPEFVQDLFSHHQAAGLTRYAAAVGMVWGLAIGIAVSGFSLLIFAIVSFANAIKRDPARRMDS